MARQMGEVGCVVAQDAEDGTVRDAFVGFNDMWLTSAEGGVVIRGQHKRRPEMVQSRQPASQCQACVYEDDQAHEKP